MAHLEIMTLADRSKDYPHEMTLPKGSLLLPVSSLNSCTVPFSLSTSASKASLVLAPVARESRWPWQTLASSTGSAPTCAFTTRRPSRRPWTSTRPCCGPSSPLTHTTSTLREGARTGGSICMFNRSPLRLLTRGPVHTRVCFFLSTAFSESRPGREEPVARHDAFLPRNPRNAST